MNEEKKNWMWLLMSCVFNNLNVLHLVAAVKTTKRAIFAFHVYCAARGYTDQDGGLQHNKCVKKLIRRHLCAMLRIKY